MNPYLNQKENSAASESIRMIEKVSKKCKIGRERKAILRRRDKWYFVTKIVLTYCEKKLS